MARGQKSQSADRTTRGRIARLSPARPNHAAIDAKMLQADVDSNRQLLDSLLQSQKGVEVSQAGMLRNNIRIAEVSPMPRDPVAPKRMQNILLSALMALI